MQLRVLSRICIQCTHALAFVCTCLSDWKSTSSLSLSKLCIFMSWIFLVLDFLRYLWCQTSSGSTTLTAARTTPASLPTTTTQPVTFNRDVVIWCSTIFSVLVAIALALLFYKLCKKTPLAGKVFICLIIVKITLLLWFNVTVMPP